MKQVYKISFVSLMFFALGACKAVAPQNELYDVLVAEGDSLIYIRPLDTGIARNNESIVRGDWIEIFRCPKTVNSQLLLDDKNRGAEYQSEIEKCQRQRVIRKNVLAQHLIAAVTITPVSLEDEELRAEAESLFRDINENLGEAELAELTQADRNAGDKINAKAGEILQKLIAKRQALVNKSKEQDSKEAELRSLMEGKQKSWFTSLRTMNRDLEAEHGQAFDESMQTFFELQRLNDAVSSLAYFHELPDELADNNVNKSLNWNIREVKRLHAQWAKDRKSLERFRGIYDRVNKFNESISDFLAVALDRNRDMAIYESEAKSNLLAQVISRYAKDLRSSMRFVPVKLGNKQVEVMDTALTFETLAELDDKAFMSCSPQRCKMAAENLSEQQLNLLLDILNALSNEHEYRLPTANEILQLVGTKSPVRTNAEYFSSRENLRQGPKNALGLYDFCAAGHNTWIVAITGQQNLMLLGDGEPSSSFSRIDPSSKKYQEFNFGKRDAAGNCQEYSGPYTYLRHGEEWSFVRLIREKR